MCKFNQRKLESYKESRFKLKRLIHVNDRDCIPLDTFTHIENKSHTIYAKFRIILKRSLYSEVRFNASSVKSKKIHLLGGTAYRSNNSPFDVNRGQNTRDYSCVHNVVDISSITKYNNLYSLLDHRIRGNSKYKRWIPLWKIPQKIKTMSHC